jgi:hypothetical protein
MKAIDLIASINTVLQRYIPGQIGRFDDSFNLNCIGDTGTGSSTLCLRQDILRVIIKGKKQGNIFFMALISSFITLNENDIVSNGIGKYLNIPQNKVAFYDFYIKMSN